MCMDKCVVILGLNRNEAFLSSNDMFDLFYVNFPDKGNDVLKKFLTDLFNRYNVVLAKSGEDVISVDRVKGILKSRGDKQYGNGVEVDVLFGS